MNEIDVDGTILNICGLTLSQIEWMKRYFIERIIEIEEVRK